MIELALKTHEGSFRQGTGAQCHATASCFRDQHALWTASQADSEVDPAQDWCDGAAKLAGEPGDANRKRILYDTCKALEFLHLRSIVHGAFGPRAVMWFPNCIAWKLVALGTHFPPADFAGCYCWSCYR